MPTGTAYDPSARIREIRDRVTGQLDEATTMQAMRRLQQLVEAANAPETQALQTDLGATGPAAPPMPPRPDPFARYGPTPELQVRPMPQAPQPPSPVTKPKLPADLKNQFPAHEWTALTKRFPQIALAANQQELLDALDTGKTVLAIQAGQKMGLTPENMLTVITQHGAQKVVAELGPQLEAAPDQETAQTIMRRKLAKLPLNQQRTAELALQPMVATKPNRETVNKLNFENHISAFSEQINDMTSDQIRAAWPKYIKTVEPGARFMFSQWAQGRVNDARANERADRLAKAQGATKEGQEERLYNSIKASVHQSVAFETQKQFPTGVQISLGPDGKLANFSTGGSPQATAYYQKRMKELLDARLKAAGLFKKYGSLPIVPEPEVDPGAGALPPGIPAGATFIGTTKEGHPVYEGPDMGQNGKPKRRAVVP
jgi:hypothetical protein